jgi:hypothetical protein
MGGDIPFRWEQENSPVIILKLTLTDARKRKTERILKIYVPRSHPAVIIELVDAR